MKYASALMFVALASVASVAMAKVRCQCSDDGNGINRASSASACQTGLGYGVENDGFCYIVDNTRAMEFVLKCPSPQYSTCQLYADQ
ncbi:hypothetical protein BG004_003325 [Podila humilis]|nr:hypothetical protein BG004_003325 [Podila humilis]